MDNILATNNMLAMISNRVREARLNDNLSQQGLADRSGVSLGSLKRFERNGEISLKNLVRLVSTLKLENDFFNFIAPTKGDSTNRLEGKSLDDLLNTAKAKKRKRGRRT